MSKASELSKTVKAYILENIDGSNYGVELESDHDKVKFLYETFMSEYGWRVDRVGIIKGLTEYFAGLPSCCTVAFSNHEILELAVKWGSIPANYNGNQAFKILDNWFNLVANKTAQLFRSYKVMP